MKFTESKTTAGKIPLLNDHFVAIPYDCSKLTSLATDGVIPAGTIVPSNDAAAVGVLLADVDLANNPNGALIIHGFIDSAVLPEEPTEDTAAVEDTPATIGAKTALKQIYFA